MAEQQVVMCERFPDEIAKWAYTWAWGESGVCSEKARFLLQQNADNISRTISFAPLPSAFAPAPVTRDERSRLIAERLSAEQELTEAKARCTALYNERQRLVTELQRSEGLRRELEAQLRDVRGDLELEQNGHLSTLAALDDARAELARLLGDPPAGPSVVEG